jgi:uroporphyrinogen decarboxylase
MRQAGRYLLEYRQTRKKAGSFLDLCFTPELAAEATLQPVRRFDLDAAILFSDILVMPHALGQRVRFLEGRGPLLDPWDGDIDGFDLAGSMAKLAPVFETVRSVRRELPLEKALIGFCGAPWTVATYMIAGHGTSDQRPARELALKDPERLQALIDVLVEASARYLVGQVEAGAGVVKIFDSWAGVLDDKGFERWAVQPVAKIVEAVRASGSGVPIIAFPKGAGSRLAAYVKGTGVDAIAVDWTMPLAEARAQVPERIAIQGNLDPLRLVVGGRALDDAIDAILETMRGRAHVFNLGHGILPETPVAHVAQLIERVRGQGG